MIEAKMILTVDNFMQGFDIHYKYKNRSLKVLSGIGIFMIFMSILGVFNFGLSAVLPTLLPGIFLATISLIIKYFTKRNLKKLPTLGQEMTYQLDELEMSGTAVDFDFSQKWKSMFDALIAEHGILVYPQKNAFYWLPKSAFSSENDFHQVVEYVQNGVPRYKVVK